MPVSSRQKGRCAHLSLSLQPRASPLPRRGGISGQPASPTVMLQASLQPYLQVRSLGQRATGLQRHGAHCGLAQRPKPLVRTRAHRKENVHLPHTVLLWGRHGPAASRSASACTSPGTLRPRTHPGTRQKPRLWGNPTGWAGRRHLDASKQNK